MNQAYEDFKADCETKSVDELRKMLGNAAAWNCTARPIGFNAEGEKVGLSGLEWAEVVKFVIDRKNKSEFDERLSAAKAVVSTLTTASEFEKHIELDGSFPSVLGFTIKAKNNPLSFRKHVVLELPDGVVSGKYLAGEKYTFPATEYVFPDGSAIAVVDVSAMGGNSSYILKKPKNTMLTTAQVADVLCVSVRAVQKLHARGLLNPPAEIVGRMLVWPTMPTRIPGSRGPKPKNIS